MNNFKKFKEALKGWVTSCDGEDFCPSCWQEFAEKYQIKRDAIPTASIAETRKAADGWLALCERCFNAEVFFPFKA